MGKGITLDDIIKRIADKIKPQWWAAFFGCVICGLVAYMYIMTNNFLTYDSTWNIYSDQDMIASGRQFLTYACGISSYYNLPWVNGVLAIFFLALTSVLVVEGLGIKSKIGAVLTGGLLVTFPAISSTFCYIFTIDGYMLAVFLATAAFLLTDRKKWGFAGGIVFLGISIGIYQAYLSFTIILCILRLLLDLIEKESLKDIFSKIWRYIVMGAGAYIFYVITLKLMIKIKGVTLSGYQGTDKVGSFSLADLPEGIVSAIKNFVNFLRWSNVLTTTGIMKYTLVFLLCVTIILYIGLLICSKRSKKTVRILLITVLVGAIPFGSNIVNVLSPETFFHLLMRYSWVLFFVFSLAICEHISWKEKKKCILWKKALVLCICLCDTIFVLSFSIMANVVAFNMNERYEKTYATCLRIVDRIEQTEGYTTETKVAILGGFPDAVSYPPTDITANDLVGYFGASGELCVNSTQKYAEFMKHYMNVTIVTIPGEDEIRIAGTEAFAEMPKFPAEGSVGYIDDVLVIKLNG